MPHIDEDLEQRLHVGRHSILSPEELEKELEKERRDLQKINFRVLSTSEKTVLHNFIIQPETSLELIFFRVIFTRLRQQYQRPKDPRPDSRAAGPRRRRRNITDRRHQHPEEEKEPQREEDKENETVPFEAYQRAFERLFFLLNDDRVFRAQDYDENGDGTVSWGEFFHVYKREEGIVIKLSLCERIYFTFENPDSSYLAQLISIVVLTTIIMSSLCFIISTVDECQSPSVDGGRPKPVAVFHTIELCCLLIFVVEYVARVATCWNIRSYILDQAKLLDIILSYEPINLPSPVEKLAKFIFSPSNIVDLLAILPGVIYWLLGEEGGGGLVVLRLVRLTRMFRAFKNPAMNEPVIVISQTLQQSTKALYVLCFQLGLLIVISGSLMWLAEQGQWNGLTRRYDRKVSQAWNNVTRSWDDIFQESPFQSIPHAFWWAIVTATTVGYGDQNNYPVTAGGYIVAVLTMSVSLVITALPVGVIGGTFSAVWEDVIEERKREKVERRSEMVQITKAIQTLDPTRMSKLLFVQVWNTPAEQRGPNPKLQSMRPTAAHFMGEALLEMPLDSEPLIRQETLRLMDNYDIVKRRIKGKITVRYEWKPSAHGGTLAGQPDTDTDLETQDERLARSQTQMPYRLHGELMVTVVSAEGLVNLDGCKRNGLSSPFCMVYVYPKAPKEGEAAWPNVWRYPSAKESLSPRWGAQHSFEYRWDLIRSGPRSYCRATGTAAPSSTGEASPAKGAGFKFPQDALGKAAAYAAAPAKELEMDEVLARLAHLRHGMREMKEDMQSLDYRVGRLLSSDSAQPAFPGAPAPPAIRDTDPPPPPEAPDEALDVSSPPAPEAPHVAQDASSPPVPEAPTTAQDASSPPVPEAPNIAQDASSPPAPEAPNVAQDASLPPAPEAPAPAQEEGVAAPELPGIVKEHSEELEDA